MRIDADWTEPEESRTEKGQRAWSPKWKECQLDNDTIHMIVEGFESNRLRKQGKASGPVDSHQIASQSPTRNQGSTGYLGFFGPKNGHRHILGIMIDGLPSGGWWDMRATPIFFVDVEDLLPTFHEDHPCLGSSNRSSTDCCMVRRFQGSSVRVASPSGGKPRPRGSILRSKTLISNQESIRTSRFETDRRCKPISTSMDRTPFPSVRRFDRGTMRYRSKRTILTRWQVQDTIYTTRRCSEDAERT